MSWLEPRVTRFARIAFAIAVAGLVAGCFEPLAQRGFREYGAYSNLGERPQQRREGAEARIEDRVF